MAAHAVDAERLFKFFGGGFVKRVIAVLAGVVDEHIHEKSVRSERGNHVIGMLCARCIAGKCPETFGCFLPCNVFQRLRQRLGPASGDDHAIPIFIAALRERAANAGAPARDPDGFHTLYMPSLRAKRSNLPDVIIGMILLRFARNDIFRTH